MDAGTKLFGCLIVAVVLFIAWSHLQADGSPFFGKIGEFRQSSNDNNYARSHGIFSNHVNRDSGRGQRLTFNEIR